MARRPARGISNRLRKVGIGMLAMADEAALPLPTITVVTPAAQAGDGPWTVTVSGTYGSGGAGTVEAAVSIDGGASWSAWAVLDAAPGGGAYAGDVVFAVGGSFCRVRVRQASHGGVIAVSGDFALMAAPSIPVTVDRVDITVDDTSITVDRT